MITEAENEEYRVTILLTHKGVTTEETSFYKEKPTLKVGGEFVHMKIKGTSFKVLEVEKLPKETPTT
jgi:hypothetical protein